jgi:methyl-accepting chemotaxis protein
MTSERLLLLATAQEYMTDVADKMDKWDNSQLTVEKSAFEAMNVSDHILNISRESKSLVVKLQEILQKSAACIDTEEKRMFAVLLEELQIKLQNISLASAEINDISHNLEGETACQREIKESVRNSFAHVRESMDVAVACVEFMLAEL